MTPKVFNTIAEIKGLKSLSINILADAEELAPLSVLDSMESLALYRCEKIPFSITKNMPRLRSLFVAGNQSSETLTNIVGHENIRVLFFKQTICNKQLVDVLCSIPNLEYVELKGWEDNEIKNYARSRLSNYKFVGNRSEILMRIEKVDKR